MPVTSHRVHVAPGASKARSLEHFELVSFSDPAFADAHDRIFGAKLDRYCSKCSLLPHWCTCEQPAGECAPAPIAKETTP